MEMKRLQVTTLFLNRNSSILHIHNLLGIVSESIQMVHKNLLNNIYCEEASKCNTQNNISATKSQRKISYPDRM